MHTVCILTVHILLFPSWHQSHLNPRFQMLLNNQDSLFRHYLQAYHKLLAQEPLATFSFHMESSVEVSFTFLRYESFQPDAPVNLKIYSERLPYGNFSEKFLSNGPGIFWGHQKEERD